MAATNYQKSVFESRNAVGVEVVESPDDGGWYATIFDGTGEIHTTEVVASELLAWCAAMDWMTNNKDARAMIRI